MLPARAIIIPKTGLLIAPTHISVLYMYVIYFTDLEKLREKHEYPESEHPDSRSNFEPKSTEYDSGINRDKLILH
jgi:hypothetical protein